MIKVRLIAPGGNSELHAVPSKFIKGVSTLVVVDPAFAHGVFKSVTHAVAGTSTIVAPDPGGRIVLTDLIITSDKTANSDITVKFIESSDSVDIVKADSANAPVNIAISFNGNWEGWKDAVLQLVTVADVACTVAVGYMKLKTGLAFAEWDALR